MSDKTYDYIPDLPYVVEVGGVMIARTRGSNYANWLASGYINPPKIIDTTPAPRVPNDARIVTWLSGGYRRYAERVNGNIWMDDETHERRLEDLPGVTPDTTFTVLEERKS